MKDLEEMPFGDQIPIQWRIDRIESWINERLDKIRNTQESQEQGAAMRLNDEQLNNWYKYKLYYQKSLKDGRLFK